MVEVGGGGGVKEAILTGLAPAALQCEPSLKDKRNEYYVVCHYRISASTSWSRIVAMTNLHRVAQTSSVLAYNCCKASPPGGIYSFTGI